MPTGTDYPVAVVLVNRHEPDYEVGQRLLELAEEKGYDVRVVEAARGDHDTALSFRVPQDVAEAFNADRDSRWPSEPGKDEDETEPAYLDHDAYAAEQTSSAKAAQQANADQKNPDITPARTTRAQRAADKTKE